MLDYTNKKFIRSFCVSDFKHERNVSNDVIINGRLYTRHGRYCATTLVANHWKVFDSSINQFKNVYLVGVARQHPDDASAKYSDGVEIAEENAFINPSMTLIFDNKLSYEEIEFFMWKYIENIPIQIIRTRKEREIRRNNKKIIH